MSITINQDELLHIFIVRIRIEGDDDERIGGFDASQITPAYYQNRWDDPNKTLFGKEDYTGTDADYDWIKSMLDGWLGAHQEDTKKLITWLLEDKTDPLAKKKDRSSSELSILAWVFDHPTEFPKYKKINTKVLVEKYINATAVQSVHNVFKPEGRGQSLPLEDVALNLSWTGDGDRWIKYDILSFNKTVLKFLQGRTESHKIFTLHGMANKKCWEVSRIRSTDHGPNELWSGGDNDDYYKGPPTDKEALFKVLAMDKGIFGGGLIGKGYYNEMKIAMESLWVGRYTGPGGSGEGFFDSLGLTFDANDYSSFSFKPVKWADVLVDGEIDYWGGPDALKYLMPQSVTSGAKTIKNSARDKFTGYFGNDTEATSEDGEPAMWSAEYGYDVIHAALLEQAKAPESRVEGDFFTGMESAFPKIGNSKDGKGKPVPFEVNLPKQVTEELLKLGHQGFAGENPPSMFRASYSNIFGNQKSSPDVKFDDNLFRRFYIAFYFQVLYYYAVPNNRAGHFGLESMKIDSYDLEEIYDFCAFRSAMYINQLWTQYKHDVAIANIYALIVLINSIKGGRVVLQTMDADAFMDAVEAESDKAMESVADEVPEDMFTPPNKKQREKFYKQCSLMLNMHKLAGGNKLAAKDGAGTHQFHKANANFGCYNNRMHIVEAGGATSLGQPTRQTNNFINRLMSPSWGQMKPFVNMENHEAAGLVPQIRLWKVFSDDSGKLKEVEFEFPTTPGSLRGGAGVSGLLRTPFDRGDGVGIKEFNWVYDGETPATATKYIKGDLTLFFQTFTDFTALRTNRKGEQYRFVDLFASPNCLKKRRGDIDYPHNLHYDPEYYRLKIEVGWAIPKNAPANLRASLWRNRNQFTLVLVDHEININEDGTVNIVANYRAYIEEAMDSAKFNALNSPDIQAERDKWKLEWDKAVGDAEGWPKCSDRHLAILRQKINDKLLMLTQKQHRNIMRQLLTYDRIYYVDFVAEDVEAFRQTGVFAKVPGMTNSSNNLGSTPTAGQSFEDWLNKQENKSPQTFVDPAKSLLAGDYRSYYFFLGDLIYIVASNLFKGGAATTHTDNLTGAENTRLLLTDFQYYNPLVEDDQTIKVLNIADIPISVDFFFKWYIENVVKPNVPAMPIGSFIKKILIELVSEAMAEVCISQKGSFNTTFSVGSMTAGGTRLEGNLVDPVQKMLFNQSGQKLRLDVSANYDPECEGECWDVLPLSPMPMEGGIENQFNYVIIYSAFRNPRHPGRGDRSEDHRNGCYHIDIGRPRGLVKKVSFSKNNIKYHRESRMLNQGAAGLSMLSAVYDCKVDMIGNTLFLPGMEFWLNPYGFGGEAFGMPQHKPFGNSASPEEIDQRNQAIQNMAGTKLPGTDTPGIDDVEFSQLETRQGIYEQTGYWAEDSAEEARLQMAIHDATIPIIDPNDENCGINSYSNVMGIGGYQLVTKVECKITPGEYSTTVHAKHIFTGYAQEQDYKKLYEQTGGKLITDPQADSSPDGANCPKIIGDLENAERKGE